jgi:hypothetical protein
MAKYRFNQTFRLIAAEDFIKDLLNDKQVQASFAPLHGCGPIDDAKYQQQSCEVLNMSYFDFLEELDIVNAHTGNIRGCMDEWFEGMQLADKLRQALLWEDDENYEEL